MCGTAKQSPTNHHQYYITLENFMISLYYYQSSHLLFLYGKRNNIILIFILTKIISHLPYIKSIKYKVWIFKILRKKKSLIPRILKKKSSEIIWNVIWLLKEDMSIETAISSFEVIEATHTLTSNGHGSSKTTNNSLHFYYHVIHYFYILFAFFFF